MEDVDGQPVGALSHRGQPQVRAVGDESGQERGELWSRAAAVARQRLESSGEATPPVDVDQERLQAYPREMGLEDLAQLAYRPRHLQGVRPPQSKPAVLEAGEGVALEALEQRLGRLVDLAPELGQGAIGFGGNLKLGVSTAALFVPSLLVIDQIPERHVVSTVGQVDVAGAQGVSKGEGQGDLPETSIQGSIRPVKSRTPPVGHEANRRVAGQRDQAAPVEPEGQVAGLQQMAGPGLRPEWEAEEGRQVPLEVAVAVAQLVEMALVLEPLKLSAGRDRSLHVADVEGLREALERPLRIGMGRQELLDHRQHGLQTASAQSAALAVAALEGVLRTSAQSRHELIVERHQLAHPETGLEQELDERIVARREPPR